VDSPFWTASSQTITAVTIFVLQTVPSVKTFIALFIIGTATLVAQPKNRLTRGIGGGKTVTFRGTRNPRIHEMKDEGPIEDSVRLALNIRFRPSAEQATDLDRLLEDQQNPSSPQYHAWLTPEEFGERFGLSTDDLAKVTGWLESQGLQIEAVAKSRTYVAFSAAAGQVRNMFKTELHRYTEGGESHFANAGDLEVPEDLAPLITGVRGLDDFRIERHLRPQPMATDGGGGRGLGPGDMADIYNLRPLWQKGINGAGQKIAVVGRSQVNLADIQNFRTNFNLPKNDPQMIPVPGKPGPGYTNSFSEAVLDIEWAGSSAPNATILYVYSQDIWDAVQYAVDQNLAPVLSYSFTACEQAYTTGNWLTFDRNIAQQANAQGITFVAASGDSGVAACEKQQRDVMGVSGVWVNVPASLPEVTGVGGTEFSEGNGAYWNSMNSALSYIPETAWNDTWSGRGLAATGGGASIFFTKPSWQSGPGVPDYNARWVPDISFSASWDHDPYVIFETGGYVSTGGTSAGTPFFAGILALLNQQLVNSRVAQRTGLGNVNPRLYQLAQTTTGVFHDITSGSNIVPCKAGTTGCNTDRYGYTATAGYDPVTGLGSLNVANFVDAWAGKPSNLYPSVVVPSVEPSPVFRTAPDADGYAFFFTFRLAETAGTTTTLTGFTIDGYDYSAQIGAFFGSANLPANGALTAAIRFKDTNVPADLLCTFSGLDVSGQQWSKQLKVTLVSD
jgi:subtilase family serine protease